MLQNFTPQEMGVLWIVAIIELVLKGYALWKAAQAKHKWWFIAIFVLNTIGILPLVYILFFQPDPVVKRNKKK
jgi:hypothetical protein